MYVSDYLIIDFKDGGCSAPLAAHAHVNDGKLHMDGGVWSLDGKTSVRKKVTVNIREAVEDDIDVHELAAIVIPTMQDKSEYVAAERAGTVLAQALISQGADKVLHGAKLQVQKLREEGAK